VRHDYKVPEHSELVYRLACTSLTKANWEINMTKCDVYCMGRVFLWLLDDVMFDVFPCRTTTISIVENYEEVSEKIGKVYFSIIERMVDDDVITRPNFIELMKTLDSTYAVNESVTRASENATILRCLENWMPTDKPDEDELIIADELLKAFSHASLKYDVIYVFAGDREKKANPSEEKTATVISSSKKQTHG